MHDDVGRFDANCWKTRIDEDNERLGFVTKCQIDGGAMVLDLNGSVDFWSRWADGCSLADVE